MNSFFHISANGKPLGNPLDSLYSILYFTEFGIQVKTESHHVRFTEVTAQELLFTPKIFGEPKVIQAFKPERGDKIRETIHRSAPGLEPEFLPQQVIKLRF